MIKKTKCFHPPELEEVVRVARGDKRADILMKNAMVVDVFSGETHQEHVAVHDSVIVGFGKYRARKEMDLKGKYICPGFIDGHVHMESSMVSPHEFAKTVLPLGTTSIVADPHEIANVMGVEGIRYVGESGRSGLLNVYVMLPSCVPATDMETSGTRLSSSDLAELLHEEWVLGIGEVMNFPGVIRGVPDVLDKIGRAQGMRIDGHAPLLTGKDLNAYICAGIYSDHECTTVDEAMEKLRRGMLIMIREGTAAKNMEALIPMITSENSRRCMFVTDDRHPLDLLEDGHMDSIVRKAVRLGLDPITAIRMCTINTAEYFRIDRLGAVAPGYRADLLVFSELEALRPEAVFKDGRLVAENGRLVGERETEKCTLKSSVNILGMDREGFRIKAISENAIIMKLVPDQIVTKKTVERIRIVNGYASSDMEKDILKIAVVERHVGTGNVGLGFVKGFGIREGAIGSSVAHDSHNIVVVGVDDDDMMSVIDEIEKMGGGQAVAVNGKVIESLSLSIAGLMSDRTLPEVVEGVKRLRGAARKLGCIIGDPFMTLSFLALPVIPELKITDRGIVDVNDFKIVPLFL